MRLGWRDWGRRERGLVGLACALLLGWCVGGWEGPKAPVRGAGGLPRELTRAFAGLREEFDTGAAMRLEARLVELEDRMPELVRPFLLRLGSLCATRGHVQTAVQCLAGLRERSVGSAWEARAGLLLAHVLRRAQRLMPAQDTYREVFLSVTGRPEDREEARGWWIRGLCEQGRHAQAQEEWRALELNAATQRWRSQARKWCRRCQDSHVCGDSRGALGGVRQVRPAFGWAKFFCMTTVSVVPTESCVRYHSTCRRTGSNDQGAVTCVTQVA